MPDNESRQSHKKRKKMTAEEEEPSSDQKRRALPRPRPRAIVIPPSLLRRGVPPNPAAGGSAKASDLQQEPVVNANPHPSESSKLPEQHQQQASANPMARNPYNSYQAVMHMYAKKVEERKAMQENFDRIDALPDSERIHEISAMTRTEQVEYGKRKEREKKIAAERQWKEQRRAINREIRQREKEAKRRKGEERICAAESIHVQESAEKSKTILELSQSEQANDDDEDAAAGAAAAAADTTPACFSEEWLKRSKRKWKMQRAIRREVCACMGSKRV